MKNVNYTGDIYLNEITQGDVLLITSKFTNILNITTHSIFPNKFCSDEIDFDQDMESLGEDLQKNDLSVFKLNRGTFYENKIEMPFPITKNVNIFKQNNYNEKIFKEKNLGKNTKNCSNLKYSILIKNIPKIMTERFLKEMCKEFGNVLSINILKETAEIFYLKKEEAELAEQKMNNKSIFGRQIEVSVNNSHSPNESLYNVNRNVLE